VNQKGVHQAGALPLLSSNKNLAGMKRILYVRYCEWLTCAYLISIIALPFHSVR
jgi:hypothetical protein